MRPGHFLLTFTLASSTLLQAQIQPPAKPPQTARQALIEMFLGKDPEAFAKHLPNAAKRALITQGETLENSMVQRISLVGRQLAAQGHVETFDDGPTLLVSEQDEGKQKIKTEVNVESDSFTGENDEIELALQIYRDGQPEFLPVIPRLTFYMMKENDVWKLSEVALAARVPLTDPEYLKGVRKKINENNENMAQGRVGMIAASEASYSRQHPNRGYTCSLSDLFGKPANSPGQPGIAVAPGFGIGEAASSANSESLGYHFEITGCDGSPATKFQISATPLDADAAMKAFCSDESGTIRFDPSGSGAACLSQGQPLNKTDSAAPSTD
jgi:hypothetical protein